MANKNLSGGSEKSVDLCTETVLNLELFANELENTIVKLETLLQEPLEPVESTRGLTECFSTLSATAGGLSALNALAQNPEFLEERSDVLKVIANLVDRILKGSSRVETLSYLIAERLKRPDRKKPS